MNIRILFSDKIFLTLILPHVLGCLSQGIAALILFIILLSLSSSYLSFFEILQAEVGRIVRWSIFLVILFNTGFLVINLVIIKYYQFAPPIGSTGSKSNLKEVSKAISQEDRENQRFFKYLGPFVIFFIVGLDFFKLYFIDGARGQDLRLALTFVLPFAVALVVAHFSRIVLEAGILIFRYAVQMSRK